VPVGVVGQPRRGDLGLGEQVFRAGAAPQHLFAPGAPLEAGYAATSSVVIKRDDRGVPISSVSAPELQAFMPVTW
jgi:protein-L-isoaspartate(D-aspartate) O-methyltransferase